MRIEDCKKKNFKQMNVSLSVRITKAQYRWLKKNNVNVSLLLRTAIDELKEKN